jgi:hypothetical protein
MEAIVRLARTLVSSMLVGFSLATPATAGTIDFPPVGNSFQNVAANVPANGNVWTGLAQSFTAEDSHVSFGFYVGNFTGAPVSDTLLFRLYSGDGQFSNFLGQATATANIASFASELVQVDFSSIALTVGSQYTVVASLPSQQLPPLGTSSDLSVRYNSANNSYPGGRFYFVGASYDQSQPAFALRELAFNVTPSARAGKVRADFDGDGRSDVLWRDTSTGQNYMYFMAGTTILPAEDYLRTVDLNWIVAGIGDFDGDGKADILWRNTSTGENYLYVMDGTTIKSTEGFIRGVPDQNWQVAGVGDFDGDGKDDILWRNRVTGENYLYFMEGASIKPTEGYLRTVADMTWRVVGVGDLDGDGKADILWRNIVSGQNYLYLIDGASIKATEGYLRTVADLAWGIAAVGDFDGDGKADIVWRNSVNGQNYLYFMDGTAITNEGYLRTVADLAWQILAVGDFDGDGKSDLMWWNSSSGQTYLYGMNGTAITATEGYLRTVPLNWQIQGASLLPRAAAADRYVEAWSSADTSIGFDLAVVDPDSPATLIAVDQLPAVADSFNHVVRVRGGSSFNPGAATVSGVGTRHLLYLKSGAIYKVTLDKAAGATPAPVRLSTETQARPNSLNVVAQSATGDDALIHYTNASFQSRYVRLSTASTSAPITALASFQFPGDSGPPSLTSWITDPATGAISGYLFRTFLVGGGARLSRTDANFGNPTSIMTFSSFQSLNAVILMGSRMRNGYFFLADGALRRYDFATGEVRVVHPVATAADFGAFVSDDDNIYFRVQTGGGPQLIKAADNATSTGVVLVNGTLGVNADPAPLYQTRDYLIYHPDTFAGDAISVRKSDGFQTVLAAQPGLVFSWSPSFSAASGNRVFFHRLDLSVGLYNIVGSMNADGSDLKETVGLPTIVYAETATVPYHRVHSWYYDRPFDRLLIRTWPALQYPPWTGANTLAWMNASTGEIDVAAGALPGSLFAPGAGDFGSPHPPYTTQFISGAGAFGYSAPVPHTPTRRLDAIFMSGGPNSLLRLTNNNP